MAQTRTKRGGSTSSTSSARRPNASRAASRSPRSNGSRSTATSAGRTGSRAAQRAPSSRASAGAARSQEAETRQGTSFGNIVSKAKTPLIAGGAAAAGLVGGVALSRNGGKKGLSIPRIAGTPRRKTPTISPPRMPRPKLRRSDSTRKALGATAKALGKTAAEIGKTGYRVGELTSEVRRVREQARND